MIKEITQVLRFQKSVNAPAPDKPTLLDKDRASLRINLQMEELSEMKEAIMNDDIVEIADAIVDQMYLLIGTAIEYGLGDRLTALFKEVHSSNMSKFGEDGKMSYREDGKVLKPNSYRPPMLKPIIDRDMKKFSDIEDGLIKLSDAIFKEFDKQINKEIRSRLKPNDIVMFDDFNSLEKKLSKKIDVKIDETMGLNVATITLYGNTKFQVWE